ncbi:MAG TPA: hypothetical protein VF230_03355 [Acidimicrobiales bacterium]
MPAAIVMQRRDRIAFLVFSSWITIGLYLDGWAHNNDKPETFFTPWHGLLYSGFAVSVAWSVLERFRRPPGLGNYEGDRWLAVGGAMFALGGIGDFLWHSLFGIEVGIEGLLSPTHLLLMMGGLLAATSPLRAHQAGATARTVAWVNGASITIAAAVVAFFLQFLNAFLVDAETLATADSVGDEGQVVQSFAIAGVLITVTFLTGMALLLRRYAPARGVVAASFTVLALGAVGMHSFENVALVLAALAGGLAIDALTARDADVRLVLGAGAGTLTAAWCAIAAATIGMAWPAELPAGTTLFAMLAGVGLGQIATSFELQRAPESPEPVAPEPVAPAATGDRYLASTAT